MTIPQFYSMFREPVFTIPLIIAVLAMILLVWISDRFFHGVSSVSSDIARAKKRDRKRD